MTSPYFRWMRSRKGRILTPGGGRRFLFCSFYLFIEERISKQSRGYIFCFVRRGGGVDSMAPKRMIYQETTLEIFPPSVHITSSAEIFQEHMK